MLRIIFIAIYAFCALSALAYLLEGNREEAQLAAATPAATVMALPSDVFNETGTITYYPNNVGTEIPYLVYESQGGGVATKALVFSDNALCRSTTRTVPCPLIQRELIAYFGQRFIHVEGVMVNEHVIVTGIST